MKEVYNQNLWTFELGFEEGISIPIYFFAAFQQNDWQHDQNLNNDTFCRLPIVSAQCIIGNEEYLDTGISLSFKDNEYRQGYPQIKEAFRALRHDNVLQPNTSENDFRSSNDGDDICYNIHIFDIRYQKNFDSSQPIKVKFKIDGAIPAGIYGYTLLLTNKLVSISSDGQRMFNLG